ncbi:MAG: hypothetical protein IKT56_00915, partial [Clostridia bacterium]|nr:hypothetical protein [Clostridia bacterium]
NAINTIVKSKYTTKLEIFYLTEEEYYDTIEARLETMSKGGVEPEEEVSDTVAEGEATDAPETENETFVNEFGVTEIKYPDLEASQIDLLMIADYDKYVEYVNNGWLYNLDESIKNASKKLTDYIYPTILASAKVKGGTYAIPNNRPIGECTYMIIDKALAKEYGLDVDKVDSISDLDSFCAWVKENKNGVTPFAGYYEDIDVAYMNVNKAAGAFSDEFSLVGTYGSSTVTAAESLFANDSYKRDVLALAKMNFEGYFGSENANDFAVAIKTGDVFDMAEYSEDYEIVAIDGVSEPAEELCSSMFAVSKFTKEFKRVMEVVTLLNTSDEIRNLLQYGIENVNYELDETTGALKRMNNDYMMDLYKTGNVYMAYPEEGMPVDIWELSKKQNIVTGTYTVDAFDGFEIPADRKEVVDTETGKVTEEAFKVDYTSSTELAKASEELLRTLKNARTYEEFEAAVNGAAEKYEAVISAFLDTANKNAPYALYMAK